MNKRYVLPSGDEIIDVSGVKSLQDIAREFGGTIKEVVDGKPVYDEADFVLVPEAVVVPPTQEEIDAKAAEVEKESLIQAKIREVAISELKKDGKLDEAGEIVVAAPVIEEPVIEEPTP